MEFCDKCGALMLPTRKDGTPVLICRECGNERAIERPPEYTVNYRIRHSPREKIVVVEDETEFGEELSEDEKRERAKAILEFYEEEESE
ncbi:MAG: hypothetical protein QXS20_09440 [Candidatus Thorarchaeota archaeon]